MQTIKSKLRVWLSALCAALFIIAMSLGLAACGGQELKIDVPERIEEDLGTGTYVVPRYEVVNASGVIMAGYTVRLKSVTDPNGEAAQIAQEASTIVTLTGAGEYTFVYTADSNKVADATVIMDFADRTAPTINLSSSQFPAFYIQGVTYTVPEYTLAGDFLASKCYTKVFYNDGQGSEDEEVAMNDGSFAVAHASGKYTVLIHVEDAAGNFNDYRYARSVYSPEHYEEDIVVYFNEAFGEKQVAADGDYAGKFVSIADGGKAYGNEKGSYKVVFNGSETTNNEAYFAINVPAIANIMAYKELEMYVYVEDENCPNEKTQWRVGSKWWNDTIVKAGEWTRVTWSVENWGNGTGANCGATTTNVISTDNISGTRIRLIPDEDYSNKTPPHGTVYFSAMRAVSYEMSQVTAGDENVTLDKRDGSYHVGDTVTLTAKELDTKVFDCFLVDGKPISGNIFVATKDTHTVTTKYVDGDLTAQNMTWGTTDTYQTAGSDAKAQKLGSDTHWVLTYQPEFEKSGWVYTAAYVGGANQLFGIEMHSANDSRKLSGYGGAWKGDVAIPVSEAVRDMLCASKTAPVTMIYVRNGDMLYVYLQKDTQITFLGSVAFSVFQVSGNDFGIGERAGDIQNATLKNIKWVSGELRTNLYLETLRVTLGKTDVTTEKESYFLGETVKLIANNAPEGKAFSYFKVDNVQIQGDAFTATQFNHMIEAVYDEISELTLASGIETADGKTTVGKGATVTLVFNGTAPAGQYFKCFKVDGNSIEGNTFEATENTHSVTAEFANKVVSGNVQLNDIQGGKKQNDVTVTIEYVTDKKYDGIDGDVNENGSLKASGIGGGELYIYTETALGTLDLANYKEVYFYVWAQSAGAKGGTKWCNDTVLAAGAWTKITIYKDRTLNTNNSYDADGVSGKLFAAGSMGSNFIYRIMDGQDNTFYITSLYGVPFVDVEVTVDDAVRDNISVTGTFKEGQQITLTVTDIPAGQAFAYFTINGVRYDEATYTLGTKNVTVGAVFTDISTLMLGDGITTSDGKTQYGRDVTVTLSFDSEKLNGKVLDYYVIDKGTENEICVYNGEFVTSAANHTVEAVLAEPSAMTWVNGGTDYNYETVMGNDASEWKARDLDGEVYGSAEYWAVSVDVKFTSDWKSFEFIQGSKQSIRVRFHNGGYCGVVLMTSKTSETLPGPEFTVVYPTKNEQVVAKLLAGATVTCVRNGGTITMYVDGYQFFSTNYAVDHTDNWFGVGHVTANDADKPEMKNTKFITGKDKVEAYLALLAASGKSQQSEAQINTLNGALAKDNSSVEYITEGIPEGLNDENVKESGVLKITAASSDVALTPGWTFDKDTSAYDELYYYVYIESDDALANVSAGAYWKDKTQISANTWVKVTLDSAMIAELSGDANTDLSKITLRIYSQIWLEGYTAIAEKTIYVTSLYGVPKTAE